MCGDAPAPLAPSYLELEERLAAAEAQCAELKTAVAAWADVAMLPLDRDCDPADVTWYTRATERMRELAGCPLKTPGIPLDAADDALAPEAPHDR